MSEIDNFSCETFTVCETWVPFALGAHTFFFFNSVESYLIKGATNQTQSTQRPKFQNWKCEIQQQSCIQKNVYRSDTYYGGFSLYFSFSSPPLSLSVAFSIFLSSPLLLFHPNDRFISPLSMLGVLYFFYCVCQTQVLVNIVHIIVLTLVCCWGEDGRKTPNSSVTEKNNNENDATKMYIVSTRPICADYHVRVCTLYVCICALWKMSKATQQKTVISIW